MARRQRCFAERGEEGVTRSCHLQLATQHDEGLVSTKDLSGGLLINTEEGGHSINHKIRVHNLEA